MSSYAKIIDVQDDGNYGFQCVAADLRLSKENEWLTVRRTIIADLLKYKDRLARYVEIMPKKI